MTLAVVATIAGLWTGLAVIVALVLGRCIREADERADLFRQLTH